MSCMIKEFKKLAEASEYKDKLLALTDEEIKSKVLEAKLASRTAALLENYKAPAETEKKGVQKEVPKVKLYN